MILLSASYPACSFSFHSILTCDHFSVVNLQLGLLSIMSIISSSPLETNLHISAPLFFLKIPSLSRRRDAYTCVFIAKCSPCLLLSTCGAAPSLRPGGMKLDSSVNMVGWFIFQEMRCFFFYNAFTRSLLILSLVCSRYRTSHACKQTPGLAPQDMFHFHFTQTVLFSPPLGLQARNHGVKKNLVWVTPWLTAIHWNTCWHTGR